MNRKKELIRIYKEMPIEAGVYQIKNEKNEKIFIGSTKNVKTLNGVRHMLETGTHVNKSLQEDWKLFGKDAFSFEVLEILKKKEEPYYNEKEALKELEKKWVDQLQPFDERGYNRKKAR
ncbi:GIY-YIG nuclease family protein [Bacillus sp. BRMEA1]|uniref:GIY-YIG nuclease family protein n=1 Tax=Neobacillus endophyticus TaxID=2738405 RepID=UPI0015664ABE|nr:GIY-YIG nuclease family protein [Neobacillus endophyticus]NRD76661.1 GIY-YIG nuclease family protein [Neobacillus endophyticus]